ncbi:MAG: hypothetical protein AABY78_03185 [Nitrospirota bacterium]|jgi:hypothetical protein
MSPIKQTRIMVRVTTTENIIEGYITKIVESRTLDILKSKEKFLAVTDAKVYKDGRRPDLYEPWLTSHRPEGGYEERRFVAVNVTNIVSVEEI